MYVNVVCDNMYHMMCVRVRVYKLYDMINSCRVNIYINIYKISRYIYDYSVGVNPFLRLRRLIRSILFLRLSIERVVFSTREVKLLRSYTRYACITF